MAIGAGFGARQLEAPLPAHSSPAGGTSSAPERSADGTAHAAALPPPPKFAFIFGNPCLGSPMVLVVLLIFGWSWYVHMLIMDRALLSADQALGLADLQRFALEQAFVAVDVADDLDRGVVQRVLLDEHADGRRQARREPTCGEDARLARALLLAATEVEAGRTSSWGRRHCGSGGRQAQRAAERQRHECRKAPHCLVDAQARSAGRIVVTSCLSAEF